MKTKNNKRILPITIIIGLFFGTCIYFASSYADTVKESKPTVKTSSHLTKKTAMKSLYAAVAKGKIDVDGGVINVAARRGGIFREIFVTEGDIVTKGQLLAIQEDDEEQIAVKRANLSVNSAVNSEKRIQLQLDIAKRELDRLAPIRDIDAASKKDFDLAKDKVDNLTLDLANQAISVAQQLTNLESAEFNVERRKVRAPLAGRIIEATARPGVGASSTEVTNAFVLMPDAQRIVRADLDEAFVGKVVVGQKAIVSPDARPNETYTGTVMRVGEIFGRRTTKDNSRGGQASDHVIEVVIGMGDNPLLIGQRVLVRFSKQN